ncbi:MAG: hypothetical protein HYW28_00365 [Rhodospirillales bacterium]|nr:hypothetical protein [Rhodospirillales bacterium]
MGMSLDTQARRKMDRLVTGLTTKAAKIRTLDRAGYKRADIARYLDIRYQHVRNVLLRSAGVEALKKAGELSVNGGEATGNQVWAQVAPDGRVLIPISFREKLGLGRDGHILMVFENGEVRLISKDAAIARAQTLVSKYVPEGVSLVDELLAERRKEVDQEGRE